MTVACVLKVHTPSVRTPIPITAGQSPRGPQLSSRPTGEHPTSGVHIISPNSFRTSSGHKTKSDKSDAQTGFGPSLTSLTLNGISADG